MDPILATIIGGVLWLFIGSFVAAIVYMVGAGISMFFATRGSDDGELSIGKPIIGIVISWILAAVVELFVIIQVIIHIVRLVQLLTGSEVTV